MRSIQDMLNQILQSGYTIIHGWESKVLIRLMLENVVQSKGALTDEVYCYWTTGRLPLLMKELLGDHVYGHTCNIRNKDDFRFQTIPWHQDSAYILPESLEHEQFLQLTCWLPLVDVHVDNGTLKVSRHFENFPQMHFLKDGYLQLENDPSSSSLNLSAGDLVIMHHNLAHGSDQNHTGSTRWSIDFRFQNMQIFFRGMTQGFEVVPHCRLNFEEFLQRRIRLEDSPTHKFSLIK